MTSPVRLTLTAKIRRQMEIRGWTDDLINEAFAAPKLKRAAVNRATGAEATAYFRADLAYIVVEDATGLVVQISDRNNPYWKPDPSIEDAPQGRGDL